MRLNQLAECRPPGAAAQLVPTHDANQNQLMVDHTNQTPTITYRRRGTVGPQGGLSSSARLTRLRTTALDHSYLLITLHEYSKVLRRATENGATGCQKYFAPH